MKNNEQKKSCSKKKKILIIVVCILAFLFALVIGIGAWKWYSNPGEYSVASSIEIANENTKMIAHRGFRALEPENTLPAFESAGKNGFWGNECDIYRTKDGIWVVQHDRNTARMMNTSKNIEKCTLDQLYKYRTDNGINIDSYDDLKICTLEEYLKVCKKYDMTAVIEFKGDHNQQHYDEVVDMVAKYNVPVIYISFHFENLEVLRKLTDAPVMYLVHEVEDDDIELAQTIENCGIDFDGNKDDNLDDINEVVKEIKDAGLEAGVWTIDDLDIMKKYVDLGVDYITTNAITY